MAKKLSQENPFGLRIPKALKARIYAASKISDRSLNAEMLYRLEASFGSSADLSAMADVDLISELLRRYGRGTIQIDFSMVDETKEQ